MNSFSKNNKSFFLLGFRLHEDVFLSKSDNNFFNNKNVLVKRLSPFVILHEKDINGEIKAKQFN